MNGMMFEVLASGSSTMPVKKKRTIVFSRNSSSPATGRGSDENATVGLARAYADLLTKLGDLGAITITSDDWEVDDVPVNYELKSFDKYGADGKTKPGPLVQDSIDQQFFDDVDPPFYSIDVTAHLAASSGTIIFVWTWGPK